MGYGRFTWSAAMPVHRWGTAV